MTRCQTTKKREGDRKKKKTGVSVTPRWEGSSHLSQSRPHRRSGVEGGKSNCVEGCNSDPRKRSPHKGRSSVYNALAKKTNPWPGQGREKTIAGSASKNGSQFQSPPLGGGEKERTKCPKTGCTYERAK